ncbi:hypothetical protein AAZX31_18G093100 [Glycine max]
MHVCFGTICLYLQCFNFVCCYACFLLNNSYFFLLIFTTLFFVPFYFPGLSRRSIHQKNIHRGFSERNDYWFGIWRGGNHMYIGLRWSFFCSGNT